MNHSFETRPPLLLTEDMAIAEQKMADLAARGVNSYVTSYRSAVDFTGMHTFMTDSDYLQLVMDTTNLQNHERPSDVYPSVRIALENPPAESTPYDPTVPFSSSFKPIAEEKVLGRLYHQRYAFFGEPGSQFYPVENTATLWVLPDTVEQAALAHELVSSLDKKNDTPRLDFSELSYKPLDRRAEVIASMPLSQINKCITLTIRGKVHGLRVLRETHGFGESLYPPIILQMFDTTTCRAELVDA